jgi:hypothetical protein
MARCTDLCTKYTKGYCALCEARAMADRFCWRWFKGGVFLDAWRVLQRGLSGNAAFWNVLATITIALATTIYTYTSMKQWNIMERQLVITEYQQRPWLGVSQTDFQQALQPSIGEPAGKALALTMTFPIKNFGTMPAFAVNASTSFILPFRPSDSGSAEEGCQEAEKATQSGRGQVIFPGSDFTSGVTESGISPENMQAHSFVSIRICIFYRDTAHQMHYTKMRLIHTPITELVTVEQEAT